MTDKEQIIIDGVDVSECVSFDKLNGQNICCYEDTREDKIPFANFCVENKDCYFKQLQRKTAECEDLKVQLNDIACMDDDNVLCYPRQELKKECEKYKQAIDEIEIYCMVIKQTTCDFKDCDNKNDVEFIKMLLDIINKAKDGNVLTKKENICQ